jgi:hypothetical protein
MSFLNTTLFSAATANSQSTDVGPINGGLYTVFAYGTFDTCTVKAQVSPDGTEWFDLDDATFTAKGAVNLSLPEGAYIRGDLSSVGGSTSVSLVLLG